MHLGTVHQLFGFFMIFTTFFAGEFLFFTRHCCRKWSLLQVANDARFPRKDSVLWDVGSEHVRLVRRAAPQMGDAGGPARPRGGSSMALVTFSAGES